MKPRRARGRPVGFSRAMEAAALFNALLRRQWTYGDAMDAVTMLTDVDVRTVERYRPEGTHLKFQPTCPDAEDNMGRWIIIRDNLGSRAELLGIKLPDDLLTIPRHASI